MKQFFAALVFATLSVSAFAEKKPNILFAFADDWGCHASAYAKSDGSGSAKDVISTQNFDRVVREGVLFQDAHVTAPSCAPCCSSLYFPTASATPLPCVPVVSVTDNERSAVEVILRPRVCQTSLRGTLSAPAGSGSAKQRCRRSEVCRDQSHTRNRAGGRTQSQRRSPRHRRRPDF